MGSGQIDRVVGATNHLHSIKTVQKLFAGRGMETQMTIPVIAHRAHSLIREREHSGRSYHWLVR